MIIISIDPGYERLGIAVIEKEDRQKESLLYSECFQTSKDLDHYDRLVLIGNKVREIITKYKPTFLAIEKLFLSTNHKTAMFVSEACGVILYESRLQGLLVESFSPPQIKLAVCGNGKADKKSIMKMIPLLISLHTNIKYDDEYDAIAVGLTFFAHKRYPQKMIVA